jgi:hypothetical protein
MPGVLESLKFGLSFHLEYSRDEYKIVVKNGNVEVKILLDIIQLATLR